MQFLFFWGGWNGSIIFWRGLKSKAKKNSPRFARKCIRIILEGGDHSKDIILFVFNPFPRIYLPSESVVFQILVSTNHFWIFTQSQKKTPNFLASHCFVFFCRNYFFRLGIYFFFFRSLTINFWRDICFYFLTNFWKFEVFLLSFFLFAVPEQYYDHH